MPWLEFVFLPGPVSAGNFPLGKADFPIFFTVKQIFLKINSWPAKAAKEKRKELYGI
jgi:hypothetical protein